MYLKMPQKVHHRIAQRQLTVNEIHVLIEKNEKKDIYLQMKDIRLLVIYD